MSSDKADGKGKDALADYMRALKKLNDPEKSSATTETNGLAAKKAAGEGAAAKAAPPPKPAGDDTLNLYLQAVERAKTKSSKEPNPAPAQASPDRLASLQAARGVLKAEAIASEESAAAEPEKSSSVLRRGLDRLQNRGRRAKPARKKMTPRGATAEASPEAPLAFEAEPAPRKVKAKPARKPKRAKPAARRSASDTPFNMSPISLKAGALLLSLVVGLLLQRWIYYLGEMPYVLHDLGIGAAAVLPALLILLLVHPESRSDWTALLASVAAIAVTGGLGIALGVSLLHANALAMHEAGYVIQLFVHLAILSVLWGPVFLTVAGLLHRMELLKLSDPMEY